MLVYGLIVNCFYEEIRFFALYQLSYNCFWSKSKPNLVTVNWFILLMQMSFYDSFFLLYPLKQYFSKIGTRETFVYQNFSLGKITKVDLQNPLKIVLFYENFNTVVTLDNQLNEIQKSQFFRKFSSYCSHSYWHRFAKSILIYNSLNQQIGLLII
jgi:hypothetical protein